MHKHVTAHIYSTLTGLGSGYGGRLRSSSGARAVPGRSGAPEAPRHGTSAHEPHHPNETRQTVRGHHDIAENHDMSCVTVDSMSRRKVDVICDGAQFRALKEGGGRFQSSLQRKAETIRDS